MGTSSTVSVDAVKVDSDPFGGVLVVGVWERTSVHESLSTTGSCSGYLLFSVVCTSVEVLLRRKRISSVEESSFNGRVSSVSMVWVVVASIVGKSDEEGIITKYYKLTLRTGRYYYRRQLLFRVGEQSEGWTGNACNINIYIWNCVLFVGCRALGDWALQK
ncbi:hypothetical protein ABW21_db0200286 [Orbilia brochopaga]|nr:hypothetical protein ABW21_db0200286 [Drechslerella brochopaga]